MKLSYRLVFIPILVFSFLGCEREINIVPNPSTNLLVVEATIENGAAPRVVLTQSLPYFKTFQLNDFENSFVHNALVTVSSPNKSVLLKEYSSRVGNTMVYFYTLDQDNPTQWLFGELNASYKLSVVAAGETYQAQTTIPDTARRITRLHWQAGKNEDSSLVNVFANIIDRPGLGNYVRYFSSVNDSSFVPGWTSVVDDILVDGKEYEVQLFKGQFRNDTINRKTFGYFQRGQKVQIKLSNIDKTTYEFWRTWEENANNLGNPFGTSVKILGNISNGALGYFGGYASQITELQIPN